ncbi:MAG: YdhR family protein [Hylemonella sp.]
MITEYVLFALPQGISREEVVRGMHEVAPRWQREPGLIRKTFVYDAAAGQAGAFYLWKQRADAERAHDQAWRDRIRQTYGSEPVIRYFETPLVVDNALGRLVEEDRP